MSSSHNNLSNRDHPCPYQGLMPYREKDSPYFFGREKWSRIISDNLMASRLTLLYGSSGVGKSSVLRAGVAYHLREVMRQSLKDHDYLEFAVVVFNAWRDDPITELVKKIESDIRIILPDVLAPIPESSLADTLQNWAKLLGKDDRGGKLFIILDQFEEYFLYHPYDQGKGTFADEFPLAVNRSDLPVNFLISLREDSLAKLDRFKGSIPNLFGNYLRIPHLDEQSAIDAIRQPIRIFNQQQEPGAKSIGIETEVVQEVIEQVKVGKVSLGESGRGGINLQPATPAAETQIETPYLQLVMTRLWEEEMNEGLGRLRLETLKKLGGAENIVKQHLKERMSRLSGAERDMAAKVFQYLVTPGGTKIAYPALELAESATVNPKKLEALLETLSGGEYRILRPVGTLPDNPEVERYEIFHNTMAPAILDWKKQYQQQQKNRDSLIKVWGFGIVAVIMLGLFLLAESQRSNAAINEIESTLNYSEALFAQDKHLDSLKEGLKAYKNFREMEKNWVAKIPFIVENTTLQKLRLRITQVLTDRLIRVNEWKQFKGESNFEDVSFSPDGKTIAASTGRIVQLWQKNGNNEFIQQPNLNQSSSVKAVSFGKDGNTLATADENGTLTIWTKNNGKWQFLRNRDGQNQHKEGVQDIDFSPDGQMIATASADKTVKLWQKDGKFLKTLIDPSLNRKVCNIVEIAGKSEQISHCKAVTSVSFSPDGQRIATASKDKTVKLWRQDGTFLKTLVDPHLIKEDCSDFKKPDLSHCDEVWGVSFSPDGQRIATASTDKTVKLWNSLSGKLIRTLTGQTDGVLSVSFSKDGHLAGYQVKAGQLAG